MLCHTPTPTHPSPIESSDSMYFQLSHCHYYDIAHGEKKNVWVNVIACVRVKSENLYNAHAHR